MKYKKKSDWTPFIGFKRFYDRINPIYESLDEKSKEVVNDRLGKLSVYNGLIFVSFSIATLSILIPKGLEKLIQ